VHLATAGQYHVLAGVRSERDAASIRDLGVATLQPLLVDVADEASCEAAAKHVEQYMQEHQLPFVCLVNNAGQARLLPLECHALADARKLFEVNFFGAMKLTQLCLPWLRQSQGRIVFVSSFAGIFAAPFGGMYSATKFALEGFADSLRREVSPFGISISLVEPGYIKTGVVDTSIAASAAASRLSAAEMVAFRPLYANFYEGLGGDSSGSSSSGSSSSSSSSSSSNGATATAGGSGSATKRSEVAAGSDPIVVAEAIDHALRSPQPKTRYIVANTASGLPAIYLAWLAWFLPDRLQDKIIGC
jgi:NAD(P)-dependent dehydrogenase (short-subunit alcohol dehydrogenase family)